MNSIADYVSSSDSEIEVANGKGEEKVARNNANDSTRLKRYKKLSKAELKRRRLNRKNKGPWGSWSSSEESSGDERETVEGKEELLLKHDDKEHESLYADESDSNTDLYRNKENSTLYSTNQAHSKNGFLYPPNDVDVDLFKPSLSFKCYLPKKIKYTFAGHENGTTALKFLPKTGHLFLSGGNDDIIKIWNFYSDKKCIRDYKGHSKAIKSLNFVEDGTSFISSSFDQSAKIWDTETGNVKKRLKFRSTPNATAFRPLDSGNEFIVGLSNSVIVHYDLRVGSKDGLVQRYDHHLGSILALKFFPDGTKFISSSEDKTVRIWENQINNPIKQISDTTQYSMPTINIHPTHSYFCAQSLDNSIYSYSMKPKYKRHPNKIFKGQNTSGYGIDFDFSSDGHYLCSGDSKSKILVWDWTTSRLLKEIPIPGKKPITQVQWHPQETSKVLCSGVVGKIYMLD